MELYDLEFKFLPEICELYERTKKSPGISMDEDKLVDIDFIKKKYQTKSIDWNNFKFEKKELSNNVKEFIYSFGTPNDHPLCYYAVFYVDESNKIFEYFTLEKTINFIWE